jgi:hypothetical protein
MKNTALVVGGGVLVAVGLGLVVYAVVSKNKKEKEKKKEVYAVQDASGIGAFDWNAAQQISKIYDAPIATASQMQDAWKAGADWCASSWIIGQDGKPAVATPVQDDISAACGRPVSPNIFPVDQLDRKYYVALYGVKPPADRIVSNSKTLGFTPKKYSMYS